MDKAAVIPAHFPCDLTDCFDEGLALYIADGAAYLGNYHVCIGGFADVVDESFNLVGNVGDNLNGLS